MELREGEEGTVKHVRILWVKDWKCIYYRFSVTDHELKTSAQNILAAKFPQA